jgi:uncharacterized membrane protein
MLIPKKNRVEVYKYLFQEGVLYAKKDFNAPKHPEIDVPNLQVIKLMQSFKSKEYVKESFAWRHYYWSVFLFLFLLAISATSLPFIPVLLPLFCHLPLKPLLIWLLQ